MTHKLYLKGKLEYQKLNSPGSERGEEEGDSSENVRSNNRV